MITPLMHILSCYDEHFRISSPVNILYLNKKDRELVISESKRLCALINDGDSFYISTSDTGKPMVCEVQNIAGSAVTLNPYTALMLTRIHNCVPMYLQEVDTVSVEVAEDDLSTDAVILRLEGNPKYIYYYVYNIMEMPSLTYQSKILKLKELLLTIISHPVIQDVGGTNDVDSNPQRKILLNRLQLHSNFNYWKSMMLEDYIKYYGTIPPEFDESVLKLVKKELWDAGFYGFVNPLEIYLNFNSSRVTRKLDVDIEDWVLEFLTKCVLSGGEAVA